MSDIYSTASDSAAGADIGSLLGTSRGMAEGLASIGRDKAAATDKIIGDTERQLDRDKARTNKAFEATGIGPDQLQPWDEQKQHEKFSHEPLEAFGSLGSVVGILASAFTHAPMETAFGASAAAMNAIKAGDDQEYERAHTAWKENMALVEKRHNMMRDSYSDAITLMKTNMAAGEAKLSMEAARYGDRKTQFLLENGMNEELFKLMDSRNKAVEGAVKASNEITESTLKNHAYDTVSKGIDEAAQQAQTTGQQVDPTEVAGRKLAAFNRIFHTEKETPAQQIMGTFFAQHPTASAEEAAKFADEHHLIPRYGVGNNSTPNAEIMTRAKKYEDDPDSPTHGDHAASYDRAAKEVKAATSAGGNTNLTIQRQNAAAADTYAKKLREDNPSMNEDEVQKKRAEHYAQLQTDSAGLTGPKKDQLQSRVNQIKYSVTAIDKIEALLKKHNALTGLGGKITRPGETIASIFGSNETDRHEFESLVSEVKEWAPRILTDSTGRPLSAEAGNMDKIVRGLNLGDTTKITAERLYNLKKQYQEMSADTEKRKSGSGEAGAKPEAPAATGPMPWQRDPIRSDKRSDAGSSDKVASASPKGNVQPLRIPAGGNHFYQQKPDGTWWIHDNFGPVGPMPPNWSPPQSRLT